MVSKLAVGIIVLIVVVGGGAAAYVLMRPSEAPETYELSYDYEVGEYYVYETATSTTMDDTVMEEFSTYSMQVTAVNNNEITCKYIETIGNIGPPQSELTIESAEVTMEMKMTNKGKMISWEIESVVPLELWENVELYEDSQMMSGQLFESLYMFPSASISIGQEWETSISDEIEWMPGTYMPLMGEGSTHFVGQENVTVEAGTFDCWRLDYGASISGELEYMGTAFTMDMTLEGTSWYSKQNCTEVKMTMSMIMSMEFDDDKMEYLTDTVMELVEYGTI